MMRRAVLVPLMLLVAAAPARAGGNQIMQDPLGRLSDVTANWEHYQPSHDFCVPLDGFDFHPAMTGEEGQPCTAEQESALAAAGLCPEGGCTRTFRVRISDPWATTPDLCSGCVRLFIDYTTIPENDPEAGLFYAHGHAYWRMHAWNPAYTIEPIAHSPNIKNFTNDKLVAPMDSVQERVAHAFDTHAMAYVGDTEHFHHNEIQGPYYVGPWYVNEAGEVIRGSYLDVDPGMQSMGNPVLDEIRYWAGFNSGEASCPDNLSAEYADGDYYYGACATHPGLSSNAINPFA